MKPHIGIVGAPRAGKDTIAKHLVEHHGYKRLAFADPLKDFVYETDTEVRRSVQRNCGWEAAKDQDPYVRMRLNEVGDAARRYMLTDVWVQRLHQSWPDNEEQPVVVPDVRKSNEAAMLARRGAIFINVRRPDCRGIPNPDLPTPPHYIHNLGTLEELHESVNRLFRDPRCFWCRLPMDNSPSDDFCSERCESGWMATINQVAKLPRETPLWTRWGG